MIGCDLDAIERGEDRKLFNEAMADLGLEVARSGYAYSVKAPSRLSKPPAIPAYCVRASPWAAPAAASRTTRKSSFKS